MRRPRPPSLPSGFQPPHPHRLRRKGCPYVADVIERARVLVEGTAWPESTIAAHVGIDASTVNHWKVRRRWRRPGDASLSTGKVALARAGFTRRCREVLRRTEHVAAAETARLEAAEAPPPAALERARALVAAARAAQRRRPRSRGAAP